MTILLTRRGLAACAAAFALSLGGVAQAEPKIGSVHFLIPGGAGGGWDGTARGVGEALTRAGLVGNASFENMSGGGGGKAMTWLIDNARSNYNVLMVNSTPMIIRGLNGEVDQTFRDLTNIAGVVGDYAALVVNTDSPINSFGDLKAAYDANPNQVAIGGGSVPGGMDHLITSMIMQASGADPLAVKYIPYDTGGPAMAALLSGEIKALSTGLSEAIELARAGEVKIIGITATERVPAYPDAPTFREQGVDMEFVNWRGFFAAPGLPEDQAAAYRETIAAMYETEAWEEVRARNGWVNIHNSGPEFTAFLEKQEAEMKALMTKLGFL
ncbi:Bug family tripartite tricarboxylate transporter substrate binding protein [Rubrimonas cliftonensis]|uniref:Putative tricarboxylic transport membrane protein n=1 Tax=Rubrimonas cliftonensis TaxID=89524 RepID=A0A1H4ECG4_9RHOB|nr:tripartite tricarboxylate transporter substrate binding protein [Rubrimonas cliftonensis]SEA82741.1 putative tricarboxylic transport membrane protein [Rubrimonas cliftonensis]